MSTDLDAIEASFDEADFGEFEEAMRQRPISTPPLRSSYSAQAPRGAASQGQVKQAARTLDSKIETLSTAIKALEARTDAISAKAAKTAAGVAREAAARRRSEETIRAELQQAKLSSVLLPAISDKIVTAMGTDGHEYPVVTRQKDGIASLAPLLALAGPAGGSGQGLLGGDVLTTMLLIKSMNP